MTSRPRVALWLVAGVLVVVAGPWSAPVRITAGAALALIGMSMSTVEVRVDQDGLTVAFGPWRWPVKRIPLKRIADVDTEQLHPMQHRGFGYRFLGTDTAVIVTSGPALSLDLHDDETFIVTVPDAQEAAQLLASLNS